jgi:uncharacterized protein YbaP (TraB family)
MDKIKILKDLIKQTPESKLYTCTNRALKKLESDDLKRFENALSHLRVNMDKIRMFNNSDLYEFCKSHMN